MDENVDIKLVLRRERQYVLILCAIQIIHILDFVIMMPLGPQFMRAFEINPTQFSSLVSSYSFSAGIIGFIGALYADHFDRKKFLLANFTGFIVGTFMCAIATNFSTLLIARIIAGAFGGVLNACVLSLVSDLIPFERRGMAMGVVMSSFSLASIIGVPLGLYVAQISDWHGTFYFICMVAIIFWILSVVILPSVKMRETTMSTKENLKNFRHILLQKNYWQSFLLTSVLSFGIFMIVPFISPYMVGNVGLSESQIPFIYLVGGSCTIISSRLIGRACDHLGSFRVFKFVALFSLLPILILTHLPPVPLGLALTATSLFMITGSGRFIPAMTIMSAVVSPKERGTFMSLENASRQMSSALSTQFSGFILGSTTMGALTNYNVVGYISIGCTLIALFNAYLLKKKFNLR